MMSESVMADWQELQRRSEDELEAKLDAFGETMADLSARLMTIAEKLAAVRAELAACTP
jgi:hypothetical protein